MKDNFQSYNLFYQFINTYSPFGFRGIDRNSSLMEELEEMMEQNNQYFFVADLFQARILFTSERSMNIIGVDPNELNPYHAIEAAHPDEVHRNTKGWSKLIQIGNELLAAKSGSSLLSVNMKLRNPKGVYRETLFQCYLFYSRLPYQTVYVLQIHTDIDSTIKRKHGYHYYSGNDLSNFRFPDERLLLMGNPYSTRELEVIKLIYQGLSSEQIAEKIFISTNTVNTHRRNILHKAGKSHITDLILELKENGML